MDGRERIGSYEKTKTRIKNMSHNELITEAKKEIAMAQEMMHEDFYCLMSEVIGRYEKVMRGLNGQDVQKYQVKMVYNETKKKHAMEAKNDKSN